MKLPRWLVISMLSLSGLAVLGAAAWWWIIWPERTAREFAELITAGRFDEAKRMIAHPPPSEDDTFEVRHHFDDESETFLATRARTLEDCFASRLRFRASFSVALSSSESHRLDELERAWGTWYDNFDEFVAIRGRIRRVKPQRSWHPTMLAGKFIRLQAPATGSSRHGTKLAAIQIP